ncbi:hypothetical protein [Fodinibius salsisoli]|uniref:Lipoprotein n=1 Tax=Fodinibius salsisoli TaxID=2820877 RepID=A0ABT3PJ92_9BACT|nr:hypothetical protein [Fodinibius salsisoli]MCW9705992.1 hypothetical protein [Fodinibius salsisoli]
MSVLLFNACSDDPASSVNQEPPALPPISSLEIEFSTLLGAEEPQKATTQAIDYYIQAVYRAGSLEGIVESNLAKPRALLSAAEDTVAELNDDQQWEWSYQTSADSIQYQARLIGQRITANTVSWSLFVSSESSTLNDKLFLSGTVRQDGKRGNWTINSLSSTESNNTPLAELSWEFDEQEANQIRLDIISGNGTPGSYIQYTTEAPLKTVEYLNAGTADTTITQWNVDTRAGYLITPDVNEGNKACWDETLENVSCSE